MSQNEKNAALNHLREEMMVEAEKVLVKTNNKLNLGPSNPIEFDGINKKDLSFIAPIISNQARGFFAMCIDWVAARQIAQNFLSENHDQDEATIKDANCEVFNLIFGNGKAALNRFKFSFEIAPYKIEEGSGKNLFPSSDYQGILLPSKINGHEVDFVIGLKKPSPSFVQNLPSFKPISLEEIPIEKPLPFDLYYHLASSKKTICFKKEGDQFSDRNKNKFQNYQIINLFVQSIKYENYINFFAEDLMDTINEKYIDPQKRKEAIMNKIKHSVQTMFMEPEDLGPLIENTINALLKVVGKGPEIKELLSTFINSDQNLGLFESHCFRVVGYALILAIGCGVTDTKTLHNLASGAFLHDLGYIRLPIEIFNKAVYDLNEEELALYKQHPSFGLDILKSRNVGVSAEVKKFLLEHHETINGTGFPRRIRRDQTDELLPFLCFADDFDNVKRGKICRHELSSLKALEWIVQENTVNRKYTPKFIKQITEFMKFSGLDL